VYTTLYLPVRPGKCADMGKQASRRSRQCSSTQFRPVRVRSGQTGAPHLLHPNQSKSSCLDNLTRRQTVTSAGWRTPPPRRSAARICRPLQLSPPAHRSLRQQLPTGRTPPPQRPSGRYDETDSAVSYTSTCRMHDMTEFSAPRRPVTEVDGHDAAHQLAVDRGACRDDRWSAAPALAAAPQRAT
jgi:hypothetical protein